MLFSVPVGMALSLGIMRLLAAPPGRRRVPSAVIVVASLAGLALIILNPGRPEPLVLGAVGALFGARVARDYDRRIPGSSREELLRRALRGVALAFPFAIAALFAGTRSTLGESGEDQFYRMFGIIIPSSLVAGWFASGGMAPGYAWLRSRFAATPPEDYASPPPGGPID